MNERLDPIKLEELIDITKKFINGEITPEEFTAFGNEMTVRTYIPIQEKIGMVIGIMVVYKFSNVSAQEIRVGELYRALFFHVLLAGYGMIDCSNKDLINYDNYDLLYPFFAPFISSYCKDDYEMFKEFLHDTINMYNIMDMLELVDNLDIEAIKKSSEENKKILEEFESNKEVIKDLKDIMEFNDPTTAKVVEELKKTVRERVINSKE